MHFAFMDIHMFFSCVCVFLRSAVSKIFLSVYLNVWVIIYSKCALLKFVNFTSNIWYLFKWWLLQLVLMVLAKQTFSMVTIIIILPIYFFLLFLETKWLKFVLWVFIVAIRFVLSDLFHNLRSEDRHALLHVCFTIPFLILNVLILFFHFF